MALETRKCRQYYNNFESLLKLMSLQQSFAKLIRYFVVNRNKKLILNVDELFSILNELYISVLNRSLSFILFNAQPPH